MKLLEPYNLGNLNLKNRLVMAPMCTFIVTDHDGIATPTHFTHYVARAIGDVGLIIVESTGVSPEGRISDYDLGLYDDRQVAPLKELVDEVHGNGAKIAVQLNHAGRKSQAHDKDDAIYAPSPITYDTKSRMPIELTEKGIERVISDFVSAAKRADQAGFDAIELHAAHGFLINQFISPLTNTRLDRYAEPGVFLQELIAAVKAVWPVDKNLWIRVSATDYAEGGYAVSDLIPIIRSIREDIDCVHVSSGGVVSMVPKGFPGYQVDFATSIKQETKLPVIAVGMLDSDNLIDYILETDKADLIALGRALLRESSWLLSYENRHGRNDLIPTFLSDAFPEAHL